MIRRLEIIDQFRLRRIKQAEQKAPAFPLGTNPSELLANKWKGNLAVLETTLKQFMDTIMTWGVAAHPCRWCKGQRPNTFTCCIRSAAADIKWSPQEAATLLKIIDAYDNNGIVMWCYWKALRRYYDRVGMYVLEELLEASPDNVRQKWDEARYANQWEVKVPDEILSRVYGGNGLKGMPQCFSQVGTVDERKFKAIAVKMMKRAGICKGGCIRLHLWFLDGKQTVDDWLDSVKLVESAYTDPSDTLCGELFRCGKCPFNGDGMLCRQDFEERYPLKVERPLFKRVGISPLVFVELSHE